MAKKSNIKKVSNSVASKGWFPEQSLRPTISANSLQAKNPKLAKQWHPIKNGELTPNNVTASSGKKVWWKCPKGDDHVWDAIVANRNKGIGCPICSNQKCVKSNSLGAANPHLASEWHPTKNEFLTPYDVLPSASKKVWWKCPKGTDHEWQSKINNRSNGKGCPVCSGHKVVPSTSLAKLYPELALQWHPTKNGDLTPKDVTRGESTKIWWKCPKGDDHEWQATINHRSKGTGCPKCNPAYSIPELRIYCELKTIFPEIRHRAKIKKHEIDIFIPELSLGIEFDGIYWHENKHEKDLEKNSVLADNIQLIRIREEGLPLLGPNDIQVKKRKIDVSVVKKVLKVILKTEKNISSEKLGLIKKYFGVKNWIATSLFNEMFTKRKHVDFEKSLRFLFPVLAKEWHPTKNSPLLPEQFTPGAAREIWWRGKCRHEWKDTINHRTSGRGCPKCRYVKSKRTRQRNRDETSGPQIVMDFVLSKKTKK